MGLELGKLQVLEYESLQLGKHLFPSYVNFFFDIHPDIWELICVTYFGFRYFVTFIDEYLKCTLAYLMKGHFVFVYLYIFLEWNKKTIWTSYQPLESWLGE